MPLLHRLRLAGAVLAAWLLGAMSFYELTAKSPTLLGAPLPGWQLTDRAERIVHWDPPTGLLPVDKLLHEGQETITFFTLLAGRLPSAQSR